MNQPTQTASPYELLSTKLSLPGLRSPRVLRRSLLARLDAGLEQKLTLLSAPAGFGKTTLVVEWVESLKEQVDGPKVAWVSLDSGDNDPVRFWRYIFTAIQAFDLEAGRSALALLNASQQPHYEAALTALINGIAQRSGKDILVLEDYHFIVNPQIHEVVASLLDHLPPALHLALLTRSDPPLPLARLRARNEINELRALDLRFSEVETRDFLQQAIPHPLSAETSARLAARTEGWAAGFRLAALALQSRHELGEQEQFLYTFTGSHRPIQEYLATDVLELQEESIQEFLLETSLLNRLTGSLCDAVTGRNDSARILVQIERANLFLEPLDSFGQWYRFHTLFAEAMRYAAHQRLGEQYLRQLARNASLWYEEHTMISEAVEAALFAQAYERTADLIERIIKPRLVGNEYHTLLRWTQNLPDDVLRAHPTLCMTYALAILFTSEMGVPVPVDRLRAPLEMAEQYWTAEGNQPKLGEVLAFRTLVAGRQGDIARSFTLATQALARLPESGLSDSGSLESLTEWRGISLIFTGWGEYNAGQLIAARQSLTKARAISQAVGNIYGLLDATLGLGEVHLKLAEPQQAADFYRQALVELNRVPMERKDELSRRGRALLGLATVAYERNDMKTAEQEARQAMAVGQELGSDDLLARGSWVLARVQWARGQIEPARNLLNSLVPQTKRPTLLREIQAWRAWLALRAGDLPAVQRWPASRSEPGDSLPILYQEQEALILARMQIAQGEAEAALLQLERWLADALAQGRTRSELEIRILIAQVEAALDHHPQARQSLLQALALARPDNFLRVFLDEGEPLRLVIEDCRIDRLDHESLVGYVNHLLDAFSGEGYAENEKRIINNHQSSISSLLDPLSLQEERVLRLLASGFSKSEIAQDLVVSVNTVKSHVKSIYRKLNVNKRGAAREEARRLKLLL